MDHTHPLITAAKASGKKPKFLPSNVRGKDLQKRSHNASGTRLRYLNVKGNLALSERVPIIIDGKPKSIEVFKAIKEYPLELFGILSNKENPYYINRTSYRNLLQVLEEKYPDFKTSKSNKTSEQARKRILAKMKENPDLKGRVPGQSYVIDSMTPSPVPGKR